MDAQFKIEAEDFDSINASYLPEQISGTNATVLSLVHLRTKNTDPNITAEASTPFTAEDGAYDIFLAYFDEEDGEGLYEINVSGRTVAEFRTLTAFTTPSVSGNVANQGNRKEERVATSVNVYNTDEIEVIFTTDQGESRSFDFIEFERVGDAPSRELGIPRPAPEEGYGSERKVVLTNDDDAFKGNSKSETIRARNGNDNITTRGGDDRVFGAGGNDNIQGRGGSDWIDGGDGKDFLIGGGKNDVLIGGEGNDTLRGNSGRDTFVFNSLDEGRDKILDFNVNKDLFDLRELFSGVEYTANSPFDKFINFVELKQVGRKTRVNIDTDGVVGDAGFTTIAVLSGVDASTVGSESFLIN